MRTESQSGLDKSPSSVWSSVFGEALTEQFSPGQRRRNRKINDYTPSGMHLSDAATSWLSRHQNKVQNRLERKVASRLVHIRRRPKASHTDSARASLVPLPLRGWPGRMPPLACRGKEPQVVAFEVDVLAERYRESLWDRHLSTTARPGLVHAIAKLRERFLVCAVSRAPVAEAMELIKALQEKGLTFDFSYALPPPAQSGRAFGSTPYLDVASMRLLRDELGMTLASMSRRLLLVTSLELEDAEIDELLQTVPGNARLPGAAAADAHPPAWLCCDASAAIEAPNGAPPSSESVVGGGPTAGRGGRRRRSGVDLLVCDACPRPLVRTLLGGVTTLTVPHSRLQLEGATVSATLIADLLLQLHALAPHDWAAAHAAVHPPCTPPTASAPPGAAPIDLAGVARITVASAELAAAGITLPAPSSSARAAEPKPTPPIGSSAAIALAAASAPSAAPEPAGAKLALGNLTPATANSAGAAATDPPGAVATGATAAATAGGVGGADGGKGAAPPPLPRAEHANAAAADDDLAIIRRRAVDEIGEIGEVGGSSSDSGASDDDEADDEAADEIYPDDAADADDDDDDADADAGHPTMSPAILAPPDARLFVLCVARLQAAAQRSSRLGKELGGPLGMVALEVPSPATPAISQAISPAGLGGGAGGVPSVSSQGRCRGMPCHTTSASIGSLGRPSGLGRASSGSSTPRERSLSRPSSGSGAEEANGSDRWSVAPFEQWRTEEVSSPPGAPKASMMTMAAPQMGKRSRRTRNRRSS